MIGKFTFQAPSNIMFEPGASRKIDELVAGYGAKRVMLVTDKGVRGAGPGRRVHAAPSAYDAVPSRSSRTLSE